MLQLQILTSSSELNPIHDFQYMAELARCMKCQQFVVLKATNCLYGSNTEGTCIHEIELPFRTNSDIIFKAADINDKRILTENSQFFVPHAFPYKILPVYYWDMYKAGDIVSSFDFRLNDYALYDKTTNQLIDYINMNNCRIKDDHERAAMMRQLEGYLNRYSTLGPPVYVENLESYASVREVFDGKSSKGQVLVHIKESGIDVAFFIYKSLFSLAKADKLAAEIRFDKFNPRLFMVSFMPAKKKNPIVINTYGVPFKEKIHCMFMNVV